MGVHVDRSTICMRLLQTTRLIALVWKWSQPAKGHRGSCAQAQPKHPGASASLISLPGEAQRLMPGADAQHWNLTLWLGVLSKVPQ